jgi:hypothetical protein
MSRYYYDTRLRELCPISERLTIKLETEIICTFTFKNMNEKREIFLPSPNLILRYMFEFTGLCSWLLKDS